jgi:hypothetical protein
MSWARPGLPSRRKCGGSHAILRKNVSSSGGRRLLLPAAKPLPVGPAAPAARRVLDGDWAGGGTRDAEVSHEQAPPGGLGGRRHSSAPGVAGVAPICSAGASVVFRAPGRKGRQASSHRSLTRTRKPGGTGPPSRSSFGLRTSTARSSAPSTKPRSPGGGGGHRGGRPHPAPSPGSGRRGSTRWPASVVTGPAWRPCTAFGHRRRVPPGGVCQRNCLFSLSG